LQATSIEKKPLLIDENLKKFAKNKAEYSAKRIGND
jgi:hypothetical protein